MKPSNCEHEWVKDKEGSVTKVCMWCGIPQVRKSTPRPVMKCPPRKTEPYWMDQKTRGLSSRRNYRT